MFKNPWPNLLHEHNEHKVIACERAGRVFVFNFHPTVSHFGYRIVAPPGKYRIILDSDSIEYGGHARLAPEQEHFTLFEDTSGRDTLTLYLPTRTALVLEMQHRSSKAGSDE